MAVIRNKGVVYAGKVGAKMRPRFSSAPRKGGRYVSDVPIGITKPLLEWEPAA
ncbi:hypothetical protein KMC50_gp42 [Ralstonia phage Claudette]|uniref:Uncharacterized protein n=2 Tax=Gervaisevirus claudettte TaxID=2846041 RepID=A0A7G5B867_9CAUD|nr:hypothetical protein KMC50_gp42 [Ralstonia phage Claudette]QMV32490.1 hypothetical protein 20A_00041 [Ralstonia phage Alix]QMV32749.1 hypothetical protein 20Ca_00042 [Ralstonia phage Claudette]